MTDSPAPVAPERGALKDMFAMVPPKTRTTTTAPVKPAKTTPPAAPRARTAQPPTAHPEPEPAVEPGPDIAARSRRTKPTPRVERTPSPGVSAEADKQLLERRTVFVPDDVFDAVARRCDHTKLTRSQLVLLCLTDTHTRLADLVAEDLRPQGVATTGGGLFADLDLHVVRPAAGGRRQLTMSWTRAQLQVVDRLVEQVKATDRSHMITVALRAWLQDTGNETP